MTAYYNDNDPAVCDWLEELIRQDLIAPGVVDRRSILDVEPSDLKGFIQTHFFAGIGGWSYALRLAGWPDNRPVMTGSPPCFPSGVLITTRRGFVPVENVVVGDECLTHLGNWKPVVRVGNAVKPVITMVGHGHFGLTTTADHPFWSRSRKSISTRINGKPIRKTIISAAEWKSASEMTGFWWSMPNSIDDTDQPKLTHYSDQELGLLCGLYVGDGWIGKGNTRGHLILGVNENKANEIIKLLPNVMFSKHKARTGVRLVLCDKELGRFLKTHFGEGSLEKSIPLWMISSSEAMRDNFIAGWDLTDGTREIQSGSRRITTASRKLAITGRILMVSMGYSVSLRKIYNKDTTIIEGRVVSQADYYTISRSKCDLHRFNDDLHTWFKVKSVSNNNEEMRVYDLEVADDHSYVADGIIVHNCQPFSVAGKQLGKDDARHLAPKFVSLVGSARPGVLFGEQVASSDVFGKSPKKSRNRVETAPDWAWLDDLLDRLEASRYTAGAVDFSSAGVGAPHLRQRTFFGAVSEEWLEHTKSDGWIERWSESSERSVVSGRSNIGLADNLCQQREECVSGRREGDGEERRGSSIEPSGFCRSDGLANHNQDRCSEVAFAGIRDTEHHAEPCSSAIGMAYGIGEGLEGHGGHVDRSCEPGRIGTQPIGSTSSGGDFDGMEQSSGGGCGRRKETSPGNFDDGSTSERSEGEHGSGVSGSHRIHQHGTGPDHGFWGTADWLFCRDGKWRPVEPGTFPLAHGLPARVGLLRGYGNAINPIAASTFIRAFMAGALRTRSTHLRQHEIEELI